MKRRLHIDIETFCDLDINKAGVYKYAADPSFRIILFAYRWNDSPVEVIDCYNDEYPGESLPMDVWQALQGTYDDVELWAHNANFERVCIIKYYNITSPIHLWHCTMIASAYLGLPLGLDQVGKVLGLAEQKDSKGKALIKFFCAPNKSRKKADEGKMIINLPCEYPEKWEGFKGYNAQDVRVECEIEKYINKFPPIPDIEREYWLMDQEINARGINVDTPFIREAIRINRVTLTQIRQEIMDITGIDNPNSPHQLKAWLKQQGCPMASLNKLLLQEAIESDTLSPKVARVLELRQMGSRTSTSKYETMLAMRCHDGRIRGQIQHYGANRTGRSAGRGVQVHNLKKTFSNEAQRKQAPSRIDDALVIGKNAVLSGVAELLYDDVPGLISMLVRTSLIAAEEHSLVVCDFASIEAIVLAWEAGEQWVLDAFRKGIDLYAATASRMFNLPLEECGKGTDKRPKGKVAVLGLGYQGSVGALITMGALREGLAEEELPDIVKGYRAANKNIVKYWRRLEDAAKHVIRTKGRYTVKGMYCDITFLYEKGYLVIVLPSGRRLYYFRAQLVHGRIVYYGLDQVKKIWVPMSAYGGLLAENITQAIARDILMDAMYRMRDQVPILMHVHDEIVGEVLDEIATETLEYMEYTMSCAPSWAKGLPLRAEGYVSKFYKKD